MKQYLDLLHDILYNGVDKGDRTGTGTRSVFGRQLRFDLSEGFPLVTTRKINFKTVVAENLFFLSGSTNVRWLHEHGVHIWDSWSDSRGELGPMYGYQFTCYPGADGYYTNQIEDVIESLKKKPDSRRHIITSWNPTFLPFEDWPYSENVKAGKMALAPCHGLVIQFYVANGKLSCSMYQRSADFWIGTPHNIAGYAFLTHLFAQQCGYEVGDLIYTTGDTHLYHNHGDQARLQLSREPYPLPRLFIRRVPESIFDYKIDDFELLNYKHHPAIKAPVAV